MQVGCHVSISGAIANSVDNALERKCSAFQIFTRNPRGWRAKDLTKQDTDEFKERLKSSGISKEAVCAHMPYLPNLSTPNKESYEKSVDTLVKEVKRCGSLGIPYLVTHLGSHLGTGEDKGIQRLRKALEKAAKVENDVTILLENTAGQKNSVGSEFEQLAEIFSELKPQKRFGVCIDTCHAFAAGYDLRTEKSVKDTFEEFEKNIGFKHLKILHLNDSKGDIGCNLDRHYHIGLGKIGEKGLKAVLKLINRKKIPIILETPIDETRDDFENLQKTKELAS